MIKRHAFNNNGVFNEMHHMIDLKKLAQQGLYDDVLNATVDAPGFELSADEYPWVICSLSFVGRFDEVEALMSSFDLGQLMPESRCEANFYYGVATSRARKFSKAKKIFLSNYFEFNPRSKTTNTLSAFYAVQGLAFFRYSTGRFRQSLQWSKRSLKFATASQSNYISIFAFELYGHILCSVGDIQLGLRQLIIASKKSQALGRGGTEDAVRSSLLLYECSFGLRHVEELIISLQREINKCTNDNTYLKASLLIEMARLMSLSGGLDEAQNLLDKAGTFVYRTDNPYLEVMYNLTLAYVFFRQGKPALALTMSRNCAARSKERKHDLLYLKSLGLQNKILTQLGMVEDTTAIQKQIRSLTKIVGHRVPEKILARQENRDISNRFGEDKLGDLFDKLKMKATGALKDILQSGFHGLLCEYLQVEPQQKIIFADIEAKFLTIFSNGSVVHGNIRYTNLSLKLIQALSSNAFLTKEALTELLWGQKYNPLRHDNVIYSLINRSRKILGPFEHWIQNNENGYCLSEGVEFRVYRDFAQQNRTMSSDEIDDSVKQSRPIPAIGGLETDDLNHRQSEILKLLEVAKKIRAQDVTKKLCVSEATASRDLKKLLQIGAVLRLGSGRATYYVEPEGNQAN